MRRWWWCLAAVVVAAGAVCGATPPDPSSSLALLRRTSLELEDRLKRCKAEEAEQAARARRCEGSTELPEARERAARETQLAKRLQELLDKKDEDFARRRIQIQAQHDELVNQLETRIEKLTEEATMRGKKLSDQGASLGAENDFLKDQLKEERRKGQELVQQVDALTKAASTCEGLKTKAEAEALEVEELRAKVRALGKDHDALLEMAETVESRDREIENLKARVEASKRDQALFASLARSAKRLSDPDSLRGLQAFRNRTMAVLSASTTASSSSSSSASSSSSVTKTLSPSSPRSDEDVVVDGGGGPTEADAQPGVISWLLVLALLLGLGYVLRHVSLTNATLWMTVGAQMWFLVLFLCGLVLDDEALHVLRSASHAAHDLVLAVMFVYFVLYCMVALTFALRRCCVRARQGYSRLAVVLGFLGVMFCVLDFYFEYWAPSFLDNWVVAEMDSHLWVTYAAMFSFQVWVVVAVRRATAAAPAASSSKKRTRKYRDGDEESLVPTSSPPSTSTATAAADISTTTATAKRLTFRHPDSDSEASSDEPKQD